MDALFAIIVCALLFAGAVCLFFLYRNRRVAEVLGVFINQPNWEHDYRALPEYEQMLENPRYWLLWTYDDWKAWLERNRRAE